MPGAYYCNPDCLEPVPPSLDIETLRERVKSVGPTEIMVITEEEFALIKREVSLAYRWQGRKIFVR